MSHRWAGKVEQDIRLDEKLGVKSSPAYFVNGILVVPGVSDFETLERVVDAELVKAEAALASGVSPDRIYVHLSRQNVGARVDAEPSE